MIFLHHSENLIRKVTFLPGLHKLCCEELVTEALRAYGEELRVSDFEKQIRSSPENVWLFFL